MAQDIQHQKRSLVGRLTQAWRTSESSAEVAGEHVEMRSSSAGIVKAERVALTRSSARDIAASEDLTMTLSSAMRVHVGGDASITGSAAVSLAATGDARVDGSSVGMLVSRRAQVESGTIGILIARDAQLSGTSRVLIATREAFILGAMIGIFLPLVRYLLQRFAPPPVAQEESTRPWYIQFGLWFGGLALRLGLIGVGGWLIYRTVRQRAERLLPFLRR